MNILGQLATTNIDVVTSNFYDYLELDMLFMYNKTLVVMNPNLI